MRRKRKINYNQSKQSGFQNLTDLSLDDLDKLQKAIPYAFQSKLQATLNSNDPSELMKANLYLGELNPNSGKITSVFFDPNDLSGNGKGFKDSRGILSFDTLRRMGDIWIIRAIVNTRIEQIQNFLHFSEDEQKEGFTIRRKKGLFKDDEEKELSKEEKGTIENIVKFLERGGWTDKWENVDDLQTFIRKITFDSLTLDQIAFEIVRNRNWELNKFRAVDASLIRFLDSVDPKQQEALESYRYKGYLPRYCMVWEEMILKNPTTKEPILYYPWELGFGIRNKSSNIRRNGYGTSELEILVEIITWILWGMQYNGNFFCISEDSKILTKKGLRDVKELIDQEFEIFDGIEWSRATAYVTKIDDLYETKLKNGLKIKTSKEHLFYTINKDSSELKWKRQDELTQDDYCLVSINKDSIFNEEEWFIGKRYVRTFQNPTKEKTIEKPKTFIPKLEMIKDVEFWEMIGFAIGDGTWLEHQIEIFPHYTKDEFLFDRFSSICKKYDINYRIKTINPSKTRNDGNKGYPSIFIYDTCFIDWLIEIGFGYTKEKKISTKLFNLPYECKCALLRGWFSADGHSQNNNLGYKTPSLCCINDSLRQDALQLLLNVGVAAKEQLMYKKDNSNYTQIIIQDVNTFMSEIRYLQDYKNDKVKRDCRTENKWDLVPNKLALSILEKARGKGLARSRYDLRKGGRVSRAKLIRILKEANQEVPEVLNYHFYLFEDSTLREEKTQLYDIEVFNDKHVFLCNNVVVHNCQGSQPKGFINIKNANVSNSTLNEFRQAWTQTMRGVQNSHRTPIINGIDLEWVDLSKTNRDMEFNEWLKFLVIISCSVYRMDPTELGFQFKDQAQIFGQDGQKQRLQHSREKGLKPLLIFLQNIITEYLVSELNEDYEFVFTGIEVEDEAAQVQLDKEKIEMGAVAMQDIFKKYSGREFDPEKDIILNQVYQTAQSAKQQQEMFGSSVPGEMEEEGVPSEEEENPFDKYKSFSSDPIMGPAIDYYRKNLYR